MMRRLLPVAAVFLAHFVTSMVTAAYVWSHGMNQQADTVLTDVAQTLLPVLHTPFVPRYWVGALPTVVALDSLIWGITFGLGLPAAWRAVRAARVAA